MDRASTVGYLILNWRAKHNLDWLKYEFVVLAEDILQFFFSRS